MEHLYPGFSLKETAFMYACILDVIMDSSGIEPHNVSKVPVFTTLHINFLLHIARYSGTV